MTDALTIDVLLSSNELEAANRAERFRKPEGGR
jgi:hypothetical protein